MIINTEITDFTYHGQPQYNEFGAQKRLLVISYVDDDKKVKNYAQVVPDNFMYQWKLAKPNEDADKFYTSWDYKPVIKQPIRGKFSEQRVHEIIMDLVKMYPNTDAFQKIYNLNIPKTSFMDIEVDVDDSGFPAAFDKEENGVTIQGARNTINTVSIAIGDEIHVLGLANLSNDEIQWIANSIKEHCKQFDTEYKFFYHYHIKEEYLLNELLFKFIRDADCISGWNFFGYDWPYIYNRVKYHYPNIFNKMRSKYNLGGISPTGNWYNYTPKSSKNREDRVLLPYHKCMYDYMEVFETYDRSIKPKISMKLDWIAEKVLGVKKVVHQLGFKDMWEQQKKEYVFYNAIDSILVQEIDKKAKTSSNLFALANLMHTPVLAAFSSVKSIEIVQAEYLYRENKVFPTIKKEEKEKKGYEGAFVFEPTPGVYNNVLTLDYSSLYPTTIRQFNISPDTFLFKDKKHNQKDDEIKCVSGAVYKKNVDGFIPKILTDFFGQRKHYKGEMMTAIKEKNHLLEIYKKRKENVSLDGR